MALSDITRDGVLKAIEEYDRLGRVPFLKKYHFGEAKEYFLLHEGRRYDSKAIVGAAYGLDFPNRGALRAADFSGGEATVRRKLEQLGFNVVVKPKGDDWAPSPWDKPDSDSGRNYWAIVANPDLYRIEQAIAERADDLWTVKRGAVRAGDRVAIWKAKGSGNRRGVVVLGEVLTDPAELDEQPEALPYWIDETGVGKQRRVRVRYVRPTGVPLWIEEDERGVLAALSVARATGGGVYRIEPQQWQRLVDALGGWPDPEDDQQAIFEAVQEGLARAHGQGFSASPKARRAVEQCAMQQAENYFLAEGFQVEVFGKPFDLRCTRGDDVLYVEVKGTTTDGDEVLLTPNEVAFARQNASRMALYICSGVEVKQTGDAIEVEGGTVRLLRPWNIDEGVLTPFGFTYAVPSQRAFIAASPAPQR